MYIYIYVYKYVYISLRVARREPLGQLGHLEMAERASARV